MDRQIIAVKNGVPLQRNCVVGNEFAQEGLTGWAWFERSGVDEPLKLVGVITDDIKPAQLSLFKKLLWGFTGTALEYLFTVAAAIALLCNDLRISIHLNEYWGKPDIEQVVEQNKIRLGRLWGDGDVEASAVLNLLQAFEEIYIGFSTSSIPLRETLVVTLDDGEVSLADVVGSKLLNMRKCEALPRYSHTNSKVHYAVSGALVAFCRSVIDDCLQDCGTKMFEALEVCSGPLIRDVLAHKDLWLAGSSRLLNLNSLAVDLADSTGLEKIFALHDWLSGEAKVEFIGGQVVPFSGIDDDIGNLEANCSNWDEFLDVCGGFLSVSTDGSDEDCGESDSADSSIDSSDSMHA